MRILKLFRSITVFVGLLMLASPVIAGQDVPVIKKLQGASLAKDSSVMVEDSKFFDAAYDTLLIKPYLVRNKISLKIDEGAPYYLQDSFTVWVTIQITYTNASNSIVTMSNKTLSINYDPRTNIPYTFNGLYTFTGGYRTTVKIISKTTSAAWDVWKSLQVVNELQSYPQFKFYCSGDSLNVAAQAGIAANAHIDELPVSWSNKIRADEYDLEWTYIDAAALDSGLYGNPSSPDINRLFENNASRVTVAGTSYKIPLLYDDTGVVFFRVRVVQNQPGGVRLEAKWSSDYTNGVGRFDWDGHQDSLNWQATTTFAEEGKRKSVVQYYDGSLRARQTVTKDNSLNRTIVAESFYDYQGRPVIQVLPAPTLNTVIGYSRNFNRNMYDLPYDKSDFDTLASADLYCNQVTRSMDSTSGAAQYYSSLNPEKDSADFNRYIPQANGYPFTEVEYTQDATGRITRQSGVGKDYKLGSGHETRYFYGTPDQRDLDALFGTEVGDASHYFKTMVKDANGQLSVSYTDMHGRTIATALTGILPDSVHLDTLAGRTQKQITEVLSTPSGVVIKDLVMEHKKGLLVSTAGNHVFNYKLTPEALVLEGCDKKSICYDCLYDLRITITDDCNNMKVGTTGKPYDTVVHNFSIGSLDTSCTTNGFEFSFTKYLAEGSYEITKTLSVSRYGMDYYRDSVYLANNTCKTVDSFILEQRQLIAAQLAGNCTPSCDACKLTVGSWTTFHNNFIQKAGISITDSAGYRDMAWHAYQQAVADCNELCGVVSDYEDVRKAMLLDMTPPSGQYARTSGATDLRSIFYSDIDQDHKPDTIALYRKATNYLNENGSPDIVYDEGAGQFVTPQSLSADAFSQKFKLSWAEALLPFHPEYCKLQKYQQVQGSYEWDRRFEAVDTYQEALQKGYLNPTNNITANFTKFNGFVGPHPDPDPFVTELSQFKAQLENDSMMKVHGKNWGLSATNDVYVGYISMWGMATISVMCTPEKNTRQWYKYYNTNPFVAEMCAGDLDMAWRSFRQQYLEAKHGIINKYIKECEKNSNAITAVQLLAAGYQPHFSDANELIAQSGAAMPNDTTQAKALTQNNINDYYDANCRAYAALWLDQLSACNTYYNPVARDTIINRLIEVCKAGSDAGHPYGASSAPSGRPSRYSSFEQVLDAYNAENGLMVDKVICNTYLIKTPKPYDQQVVYANKPAWGKPEACECDRINELYGKYQQLTGTYSSFSDYMQKVYNTAIADSTLTQLRNLCNPAMAGSCNYQVKPIMLPPALQCNTGDVCASCETINNLYAVFKDQFPGVIPVKYPVDSLQVSKNTLFGNFMNYKLGYSKQAFDYLQFMSQCGGVSAGCDSLQQIRDAYMNSRSTVPYFAFYGNYGRYPGNETILASPEIIHDGIVQVPLRYVDSPSLGYSHFIYNWPRCYWNVQDKSRYSIEARVRMTYKAGQEIGLVSNGFGCVYFVDSTAAGYILRMGNVTYGNYAYPSYINNVDTLSNGFNDWRVLKLRYDNGNYQFYIDGKLIRQFAYATKLTSISSAHMWFATHTNASMDWLKLYDANDQVVHVEDFGSPSLTPLPPAVFTECEPATCRTGFTTFFNQQKGTSYTDAQIDSVYYASCGVPLDVCHIQGAATLRDTLINLVRGFRQSWSGSTGCDTAFVNYYNTRRGTSLNQAGITSIYNSAQVPYIPCPGNELSYDSLLYIYNHFKCLYSTVDDAQANTGTCNTGNWVMSGTINGTTGFQIANDMTLVAGQVKDGVLRLSPDTSIKLITPGRFARWGSYYYFTRAFDVKNALSCEWRLRAPSYDNSGNRTPNEVGFFYNTSTTSGPDENYYPVIAEDGNGRVRVHGTDTSKSSLSNKDIGNWHTYKVWMEDSSFKVYYDDTLLLTTHRNGASTVLTGDALQAIFKNGAKAEVDWIKVYRHDTLVYFDDFNGPSNNPFATPDPRFLTPVPDCGASWQGFFKGFTGITYSVDQINAYYRIRFNMNIDPCPPENNALTLCGRSEPVFPAMALDNITNCSDSSFFAVSKGTELYKSYKDSLYNNFDSSYRSKCLQAYKYETFTVTHAQSDYHYTLYYYDQAGNLLKTVPPAGVDVSKFNWRDNWSDSVKAKRLAQQVLVPNHTLVTQYRYNTLNQVVAQQSPDGGVTNFWYDRLGRLVVSQNAKQKAAGGSDDAGRQYSYTEYDALGRITEVGQITNNSTNGAITDSISRSQSLLYNWMLNQATRKGQITRTVYDTAYNGFTGIDQRLVSVQRNLRNRVSFTTYADTTNTAYNTGTFYTYDIHGNVDTLVQDYGIMGTVPNIMNKNGNEFKKIVYEYDLISGKVNMVQYQPGWGDRFYHKYSYDAENRLTLVETSLDSLYWEKEARYEYYHHGPLARMVLGEQQVQGVDYAYTLQGWLKGVNSSAGTYAYDIGRDGKPGAAHQFTARDAYSFTLNYYAGEYNPINTTEKPFPSDFTGPVNDFYRPLYNGNISSMATYIRFFQGMENKVSTYLLQTYKYDQLNRLTRMDVDTGFNVTTNSYAGIRPPGWSFNMFRERVSYDANGNIQKYLRASNAPMGYPTYSSVPMDSLHYVYYPGTNRLRQVRDSVPAGNFGSHDYDFVRDIDDQPVTDNYVYDEIGNMVKDSSEKITGIRWTVYGKIRDIYREATALNTTTHIRYDYDAQGNRIGSLRERSDGNKAYTWYVRDAQGNVMSTYAASGTGSNLGTDYGLGRTEVYTYGSSRLGMFNYEMGVDGGPADVAYFNSFGYLRGWRQYELTNHLGNVLTTISDKKIAVASDTNSSLIGYFNPDIVSAQDYYPFGMPMRVQPAASGRNYRFGFNGKEQDNDVKGWGNEQDYGMRIYDNRLGRFLSVDPLSAEYPWNSPYSYSEGNPINYIDIDGAEQSPARAQSGFTLTQTPELSNLSVNTKGELVNTTQLFSSGMVNSGDYAPQSFANIPSGVYERYIPYHAQSAMVYQTNEGLFVGGFDLNGRPYKNAVFKTPPRHQLTWVDRLVIGQQQERFQQLNTFTQWNTSIKAYEIITTDPSTLGGEYLNEVQERLMNGNATPQDRIYEGELRRRKQLYEINDKHDPTKPLGGANASVLPSNHLELWKNKSYYDENKDVWWSVEGEGRNAVYHRFSSDGNGAYHWSGSTGNNKNRKGHPVDPIPVNKVPVKEIKKSTSN